MIRSEHLLDQAALLLAGTVGRPRETDLRRVISTCYYALFHRLTTESAKLLVSGAARGDFRMYVRRGFGHGQMKDVCLSFAKRQTTKRMPIEGSDVSLPVVEIAGWFTELQALRHAADYDHTLTLTKVDVQAIYDQTTSVLSKVTALDVRQRDHFAFLLALFAAQTIR